MKKLILISYFLLASLVGFSQVSIWKPVPSNLFSAKKYGAALSARDTTSIWLTRISVGVVANQFTYNAVTRQLQGTVFSKVGVGMSYAHYVPSPGDLPYNDFSLHCFVFLPTTPDDGLSFAASISSLKYLNLGIGYDVKLKQPFLLTGAVYTF